VDVIELMEKRGTPQGVLQNLVKNKKAAAYRRIKWYNTVDGIIN
jgi:hypothetical protein